MRGLTLDCAVQSSSDRFKLKYFMNTPHTYSGLTEEDNKAWSLTERVKGAGGTDTQEYQVNIQVLKGIFCIFL